MSNPFLLSYGSPPTSPLPLVPPPTPESPALPYSHFPRKTSGFTFGAGEFLRTRKSVIHHLITGRVRPITRGTLSSIPPCITTTVIRGFCFGWTPENELVIQDPDNPTNPHYLDANFFDDDFDITTYYGRMVSFSYGVLMPKKFHIELIEPSVFY